MNRFFISLCALLCSAMAFSQNLTVSDLTKMCGYSNWGDADMLLTAKGWEFHEATKGEGGQYDCVTWTYGKSSYDDAAQGWFYFYSKTGYISSVLYQFFSNEMNSSLKRSLQAAGYKLNSNDIKGNKAISTYTNGTFTITMEMEKVTEEYGSRSYTCYGVRAQKGGSDSYSSSSSNDLSKGELVGSHYAVDLGLSVKWATCNVGASKPEDYGYYLAWGETKPKADYSWSTYKYGSDYDQLTKYCNKSEKGKGGFTDYRTVLSSADDAATVNWGGKWRMPTKADIEELLYNCTWEWTQRNGVYGQVVTSEINGNSIFLPAAGGCDGADLYGMGSSGCYWSASLMYFQDFAYYLFFGSQFQSKRSEFSRYYGFAVRPVCP